MSSVIILLFIILGYLGLYAIVDRICKCVEQKAIAYAYMEALLKGVNADSVKDALGKSNK